MDNYLKDTFTQLDIDNYISAEIEESINLDFKRGDALKIEDKIAKDETHATISIPNSSPLFQNEFDAVCTVKFFAWKE